MHKKSCLWKPSTMYDLRVYQLQMIMATLLIPYNQHSGCSKSVPCLFTLPQLSMMHDHEDFSQLLLLLL